MSGKPRPVPADNPPYILGLDSSARACSVCLLAQGEPLAYTQLNLDRQHGRLLPRAVDFVLATAGITPRELTAIGVCGGPGSYTGLRIGVSYAKGLAWAQNTPFVGVSRLAMSALAARSAGRVAADQAVRVLIPARAGQVYTNVFALDTAAESADQLLPANEPHWAQWRAEPFPCVALPADWLENAASSQLPNVSWLHTPPSAIETAQLAAQAYTQGKLTALAPYRPNYLQDVAPTQAKETFAQLPATFRPPQS